MSEQFKSSIERVNKRVVVNMGEKAIFFDYLNTVLYEHPEKYKHFDNITRTNEEGREVGYLRDDNPEMYDTLVAEDFIRLRKPYPSLEDEAMWLRHEDEVLAMDLEEFAERGELY